MNDVAAIVVNRNTRGYLRDCLESIESQLFDGEITTWVIDNGSTDGSQQMVLSGFPGVNLVWNRENAGYARACNKGIGLSREPFVIILNSDTLLSPYTVAEVVGCMEADESVGVVGPRILNTDRTIQYSCREFPSILDAFMHAFLGLFDAENLYSARYKKTGWDHDDESEVDWVSGAFMAVRREALMELGGFDEGYFMYVEDVDLCWRMHGAGWKVVYIPRGDVVHHIGQSSKMVSTRMSWYHHLSMLRFHRKSYSGPLKPVVGAGVALGVAARFLLIVGLNLFYRIRGALGGARRVIMPGRQ